MRNVPSFAQGCGVSRAARRTAFPLSIAMAAVLALHVPPATAAPEATAGGVRFSYTDPNAGSVHWVGEFNGWNTTANPMTKGSGGTWSVEVGLPAGEHQYKFFVDGQYIADPENPVTTGDFGNSSVTVGSDGQLIAQQATSNTAYSPKIFIGGRVIGLYQSNEARANDRFELRRPNMDIDLDFAMRISSVLQARFLMNINSETEDVEFFRSRLNFDRGNLLFTQPKFRIFAYDNDDAGTWDDPLQLVGAVGIYDHAYGFDRQGFKMNGTWSGFDVDAHYADNFQPGGTTFPALADDGEMQAIAGLRVVPGGGGLQLDAESSALARALANSDDNEDMFALRVQRELPHGVKVGLVGRTDRGFNLSTLQLAEATGTGTFTTLGGSFEEEWIAGGGHAGYRTPQGVELEAEFLRGTRRLVAISAIQNSYRVTAFDSSGVTAQQLVASSEAGGENRTLDQSNRFKLGVAWTAGHGDITVRGSVELEDHAYENVLDGVENDVTTWTVGWDRNWRYYLDREVKTSLDVAYHSFGYDPATPWEYQLWFPTGNFWLEHDGHDVSFDRMVMLGGNDVVSVRPRLWVPVLRERNVTFEYEGTFNAVDLSTWPKYAESIFRLGVDVTPQLRLSTDSRWVKYNDPVLGLTESYYDHFAELAYRFAPGIQIALSFGVDPTVIDSPVNEYAYIGRDAFLFDQGANADRAQNDFFSLGTFSGIPGIIDQAEQALQDERRIQIEAIVRF